jgi:hypothetical protein
MSTAVWYAPLSGLVFPLFAAWSVFIGSSAVAEVVGRRSLPVVTGDDRWVDVGSDADQFRSRTRRVRTGRVTRLAGGGLILWSAGLSIQAMPLRYVLLAVGGTALVLRIGRSSVAFLAVAALGILLAIRPDDPARQALFLLAAAAWIFVLGHRAVRRRYPEYRRGVDRPTLDDWLARSDIRWSSRRIAALGVSAVVVAGFVTILFLYAVLKWQSIVLAREDRWTRLPFGVPEAVLILCGGGLFLLNELALRLWAPDVWEVVPRDTPRAIVYLRNFDDDKATLRAGSYSRIRLVQVFFDVLVPVRRRGFEQVLAGLLRRFGPVIGAADPRTTLSRRGALKASLPHDAWRDEVKRWCENAVAVVVSATPTRIHPGLRDELKLLSEELSHERLVLVLGPGTGDEIAERFNQFVAAFPENSKLLDDLGERAASGTMVMVRVPGRGWDCWGAAHRTEAAYAVALDEAMAYAETVWGEPEPAPEHPIVQDTWPAMAVIAPESGHGQPFWPVLDRDLAPVLEAGERRLLEWRSERPAGYWVENDLLPGGLGFSYVPEELAEHVAWLVTDRRIVMVTRGRSRRTAGTLHLRYEWVCGLNAERHRPLDKTKPARLNVNVVCGDPDGRRATMWLTRGMSADPVAEKVLAAIRYGLTTSGRTTNEAVRRVTESETGTLTWDFHRVDGVGPWMPGNPPTARRPAGPPVMRRSGARV